MTPKTRSRLVGGTLALAVTTVAGFEGVRLATYRDVVGVPTVCFGETRGVKMGDRYTLDECKAMLGDALIEFEADMRACLNEPDKIPAKSYVAFLSLAYNIGAKSFCRSTVARRANSGNLPGACDAILAFNKAGGRVVAGLVKRRQEERKLCLEGVREA